MKVVIWTIALLFASCASNIKERTLSDIITGGDRKCWLEINESRLPPANKFVNCFSKNGLWEIYTWYSKDKAELYKGGDGKLDYSWRSLTDSTVMIGGVAFTAIKFDDQEIVMRGINRGDSLHLLPVPDSLGL
jgi:hypothetical protein